MGKAAKERILKFWPVLAIFLLVAIFSFPYWGKSLVPFPSDYLVDFFPPWNAHFALPVKNNAMPDVITQIYPWRKLTMETFKIGQWPLWNPYSFSGNPHLANFQSAPFHPFNLLFFVFSEINAWSLLILFQPLLAGIFTYLFCRQLKLSKPAALISAVAFMFSGFIVVWMAYGTLGHALLWLPLIFYGIEKMVKKPSVSGSVMISLGLAFSIFSGHFQTSLYLILASFSYLLFRRAFSALLPFVLGIGLAAPQLLPTTEFYRLAPRSEVLIKGEVIPWQYLITLLAPDFFGNPVTRNDWFGHYAEWAGFLGVIPLFLAFFAVLRRREQKTWFFLGLGVLALALTLPTPLLDLLFKLKIPVLASSAASRAICLFIFSAAVLAGFGFDQLKEELTKKKLKPVFLTSLMGLFLFACVWGILLIRQPFSVNQVLTAKRNFILPTGMIAIFFVLMVAFWFVKEIFEKKKKIILFSLNFVLFLILFLSVFDLFRFAKKWMPFSPREYVYPRISLAEFLEEKVGSDRVFGNFGGEFQASFHLPAIEGYDPLYLKRYGEFITAAGEGKIDEINRSVVFINKNGLYAEKILNLLGVKYLLHAISDDHHIWAFPFWQFPGQFDLIYRDEKYEVYENKEAFPRAFLAYNFEIIKDDQPIIDRMFSEGLDLKKTVIIEEDPGIELIGNESENRVEIVNYTPTKIEINVQSPQDGILFLSDNYYPGWQATVDGEKIKVYRADYTFRAIFVPQGEHQVFFLYQPLSFKWGLALSFLSLGVLVSFIWKLRK